MRITHLSLLQVVHSENGMLKGALTAGDGIGGGYEMYYLSRLGLVEVQHPNWRRAGRRPVYIPSCICAFSTEEPLRKTKDE